MRIFALGDPHLSGSVSKPMDVFGTVWENHALRIREAWLATVKAEDLVLIPGDISWAMRLSEAQSDISTLGELPGQKLILRGNHDYWWGSLTKVREALPEGMQALQNDAFAYGDVVIAGSRGWVCPGSVGFSEEGDRAIYERECMRLEMSLKKADRDKHLICMLHYPPFNEKRQRSGFTDLIEQYGAKCLVYGHLHGKSCQNAFEGERNGIEYMLVSADHINFTPKLVYEG